MANLDSPEALGHGIAVAFCFHPLWSGLCKFGHLPISKKLTGYVDKELLYHQLLIDGICGIAIGKHPYRLELELNTYE